MIFLYPKSLVHDLFSDSVFQWPQLSGDWYPIWINSMFEFCQKMIHSIFDSIFLYPRFNSKYYSIQIKSADSIQKIIQFNSQGIIDTGRIGKCPKIARKVSKIDKKGDFSSKMANIYDSYIHFTIKFNSKDYSISFFSGIFN